MNLPLTPVRCLYRAMDLFGPKEAVVCRSQRYTYAEFGERCERLAYGLKQRGVSPGDPVAFLSFNTHQLLEAYFAVPLIRAIVMPLNVRLTAAELTEILSHSATKILFFEAEFAPLIEDFKKRCPAIETYVSLDEPAYEDLLSSGRLERPDLFSFDENETAELFYTSGSTGTPKGVMLSHRTLYLHALEVGATFGHSESSVELYTIPLFHANGWARPQLMVMNGAKQVMVRRFEPRFVFECIATERATGMSLVPVMANALLNCAELSQYNMSSMQEIHLGGAASSPELVARLEKVFPQASVMGGYGLTETAPVVSSARMKATVHPKDDADRLRHRSAAGWPITGIEVRVVDPAGKDVPRDAISIGEIIVRGNNLMTGYYRDEEGTRAAIRNGWFYTGDMAVWDEETYLYIVDRKKDIIISGGENISSLEVEKAIFAHPAVFECAVVAAPDDKWGEIPAAIVLLKPGEELSAEGLLDFLKSRLARFKLPRVIQFAAEPLPKTGTGKILKRELREPFWTGKDKRVGGI